MVQISLHAPIDEIEACVFNAPCMYESVLSGKGSTMQNGSPFLPLISLSIVIR
jgi:hypothetical protein